MSAAGSLENGRNGDVVPDKAARDLLLRVPVPETGMPRRPKLSIPLPCFGQTLSGVWCRAEERQRRVNPAALCGRDWTEYGAPMHPLLKELQRDNDPHDVLEITPDVVLAARADREFPALAPGVMGIATDSPNRVGSGASAGASAPSVDATFRAADAQPAQIQRQRSSVRKWARRATIGFVLALCSTVAATAWQYYGDSAKAMIAGFVPQFSATSPPAPSEQPAVSDVQADAAAPTPPAAQAPQPAPPAPSAAESVAPASPEQAQLLQS